MKNGKEIGPQKSLCFNSESFQLSEENLKFMRNGKEDHLIYQTIKTGNEKKFRDHMTRQLYKDSRINLFSRFGYVVNDQIKCIHEYHQNMQLRRFRVSKDYSWNGNLHP